jgi:hypothetical protein
MKKTFGPATAGMKRWTDAELKELKDEILNLTFDGISLNTALEKIAEERKKNNLPMMSRREFFYRTEKDQEFNNALVISRRWTAGKFNDEAMTLVREMAGKIRHGVTFGDQEVQAYKVAIEEYRREAGLRDDRNYSDRKKVDMNVTGTVDGAGMAEVYEKMREAAKKDG